MANIKTTLDALSKAKKKKIRDKKKEKKDKDLLIGSNIIEPTAKMIQDVAALLEDNAEIDRKEVRRTIRNNDNMKMTRAQLDEIILVAQNVAVYDGDPDNYELSEDGTVLTYIGE